jgi:hypothetical protein
MDKAVFGYELELLENVYGDVYHRITDDNKVAFFVTNDVTVDGKFYPAGKLLKPTTFFEPEFKKYITI